MLELAVRAGYGQLAAWQVAGTAPQRLGNRDPRHAPQGVYPTAEQDRWIALSVRDDREWAALAGLTGQPDRSADERRRDHDEIDEAIARWTIGRQPEELAATLEAHGVPAAVVTGPGRLVDNPQLAHREFFEPVAHPVAGTHVVPGLPFRSARAGVRWNRTAAPTLGQHTAEVLTDWLGMTEQDIASLAEVTADWPDAYDNGRSE